MAAQILDVKNLSKNVGGRLLFENVNFTITEGQQVGLIAKNGTGKTTLLSILAGDESADSGTVAYRNDVSVAILRQEPKFPQGASVIEACCPGARPDEALMMKAKQYLTVLDITRFDQPIAELSGGQQKRVALAQVLTADPDFLILDEPTNHLDLKMIEWLEGYLRWAKKTLLLVTHDRIFLENICNTILELENETVFPYRGNYSYYLEVRKDRMETANTTADRVRNMYRRELEYMRSTLMFTRRHSIHRVRAFEVLKELNRDPIVDEKMKLETKVGYMGNKIFEAEYVCKAFGDKVILRNFCYNFSRGEKMGIVGENGTGKSTFVKMLLGLVKPDNGGFTVGSSVKFGYYSQEGIQFDEQKRVIDAVREIAEYVDLGDGKLLNAKQFLQYFLFEPEQQFDYIYKLSGGEKRRLYLCTVLMRNPNFLILDEPTNDLDIVSLQTLEDYLKEYKGCVIVVSHDRYFMDKVVDHLLVFQGNGIIKDFPGNYTQYREWQNLQQQEKTGKNATAVDKPAAPARSEKTSQPRRLTYKERREYEQLEEEIEKLTAEKNGIEQALSGGTATVEQITEMSKRLPLLTAELDQKELRWLELSEWA